LLGRVTNVEKQNNSFTLLLSDGTGSVRVIVQKTPREEVPESLKNVELT